MWEDKKILVFVKTSPHLIKSGREVVCTAGIDIDTKKWIRIYPIQYRNLNSNQKFSKYQVIQAQVKFDKSDFRQRPDSYKVNQESIKLIDKLSTTKDYSVINKYFFKTCSNSLEELVKNKGKNGTSLGAFKPKSVNDFKIIKHIDKKQEKRSKAFQTSLFSSQTPLIIPPFNYKYSFTCNDSSCKTHEMNQTAWELTETARKWIQIYKKDWKKHFKKRFFDFLFIKRETWFVVGTNALSGHFMLIGYYSPYRKEIQNSLFAINEW